RKWQFAYYQEQNCPLRKRSGKYISGRGPRRPSATRRRSSARSINTNRRLITTRWNSQMVGSSRPFICLLGIYLSLKIMVAGIAGIICHPKQCDPVSLLTGWLGSPDGDRSHETGARI